MKVLKSGIEIDPSDLSKVKGGACACHCDIGVNGENLHIGGHELGSCRCFCFGLVDAATVDSFNSAIKYIT